MRSRPDDAGPELPVDYCGVCRREAGSCVCAECEICGAVGGDCGHPSAVRRWSTEFVADHATGHWDIKGPTINGLISVVADTYNRGDTIDPEEDRANAYLLSAAVDLLENLQAVMREDHVRGFLSAPLRRRVARAVRKALEGVE